MVSFCRVSAPLVLAAALGTIAAGCGVGQGEGKAKGELFVLGCSASGDYQVDGVKGTADHPVVFDLNPTFFVGEPFDDPRMGQAGSFNLSNRIVLRLQRSGLQQDLNDMLTFEINNSWEVARCVRGRKYYDAQGALTPDWDQTLCDRPSDEGPARVRVHSSGIVRAFLTPRATCSAAVVASASAIGLDKLASPGGLVPSQEWKSWIELQEFGVANTPSVSDPLERKEVSRDFRISLGQRLQVINFELHLLDDRILSAVEDFDPPPPALIGGWLSGYFDFDLVRGQGAQTFP